MTTTHTDPATVRVLGLTLKLRGANEARASWRAENDGFRITAYRLGNRFTVSVSVRVDGHPAGLVKGEGVTLEEAADACRANINAGRRAA